MRKLVHYDEQTETWRVARRAIARSSVVSHREPVYTIEGLASVNRGQHDLTVTFELRAFVDFVHSGASDLFDWAMRRGAYNEPLRILVDDRKLFVGALAGADRRRDGIADCEMITIEMHASEVGLPGEFHERAADGGASAVERLRASLEALSKAAQ